MAISPQDLARVKELAKELAEIVGGRHRNDGTPKIFDELESETNLIGDWVTPTSEGRTRTARAAAFVTEPDMHRLQARWVDRNFRTR